jgi:hypothetical protein
MVRGRPSRLLVLRRIPVDVEAHLSGVVESGNNVRDGQPKFGRSILALSGRARVLLVRSHDGEALTDTFFLRRFAPSHAQHRNPGAPRRGPKAQICRGAGEVAALMWVRQWG